MKSHDRIAINPDVMFGKPVIKDTRITVELILHELADGMTLDDILKDHPHLTVEDIRAAQHFAADYLSDDEIIFSKTVAG
jgi:uncharacterized protein (DUF433 family)